MASSSNVVRHSTVSCSFSKIFPFVVSALVLSAPFVVADSANAATTLQAEITKMKQVATALQDVCEGATEATLVVLGIHYSGKFIKYALG